MRLAVIVGILCLGTLAIVPGFAFEEPADTVAVQKPLTEKTASETAAGLSKTLTVTDPEFLKSWVATGAVEIAKVGGKRYVLAESLQKQDGYLARFLTDEEVPWIEIRRIGSLIDEDIDPASPGEFIVSGDEGEKVGVRVPNPDGFAKPKRFVLEFPGKPAPPPAPAVDEGIKSLSSARANALNDPGTRARLKEAIEKQVEQLADTTTVRMEDGIAMMVEAIESVLKTRPEDVQDVLWKPGWRTPIANYIQAKGFVDLNGYLHLMSSAAKGL